MRQYELFLKDIIEAIEKIKSYTFDLDIEDFKSNTMAVDACLRNLEVIGEATTNIPVEIKQEYKEIPWIEIKDFRNVVIYKYFSVDIDILWNIIETKLDSLKEQIEAILINENKEKKNK